MSLDRVGWGSPQWMVPAVIFALIAVWVVVRSYRSSSAVSIPLRAASAACKLLGILLLCLCLLEPLHHGTRARPGANLFVVLVDDSLSLQVCDNSATESRGEVLRRWIQTPNWLSDLARDFDLRRYVFDSRLRAVEDFSRLAFDGTESRLSSALTGIASRYEGRPLAGILLFTDGNTTDGHTADGSTTDGNLTDRAGSGLPALPPVYPVVVGRGAPSFDLSIGQVSVSETRFESAPVTVHAEVLHTGYEGRELMVQLADAAGAQVGESVVEALDSGRANVRFELKPRSTGVEFYSVMVAERPVGEDPAEEATRHNNQRYVIVDRGGGPYRVLYVSGRPNWEFKFLRRALREDEEIELVGLVRIAKREPKFDFRSRFGESTNPIFRGFSPSDDEVAERYDEPVFLHIGDFDEDEEKERGGFPKSADQLYRYDAVILDDVEAEFFSADQMALLRDFVARRGGGLLMLGGQECFAQGGYQRTPVAELLPVYVAAANKQPLANVSYRFELTREGLVQPWVRLRPTEAAERDRRDEMPAFRVLNRIDGIKPGATVLARAVNPQGEAEPALVVQRFGKGRSAALLLGDLWRWTIGRKSAADEDPAKFWRQTVRWLVSDVPRRVEVVVGHRPEALAAGLRLGVRARDELFEPLDNANVEIEIEGPDGTSGVLRAAPSSTEAGLYETDYVPRVEGPYRAKVRVTTEQGEEVSEAEVGWSHEATAREYARLEPDRDLLADLARRTGGELVDGEALGEFVRALPSRQAPITDSWVSPLWDHWAVFCLAVVFLCGEWGLRRWRGLP